MGSCSIEKKLFLKGAEKGKTSKKKKKRKNHEQYWWNLKYILFQSTWSVCIYFLKINFSVIYQFFYINISNISHSKLLLLASLIKLGKSLLQVENLNLHMIKHRFPKFTCFTRLIKKLILKATFNCNVILYGFVDLAKKQNGK